MKTTKRQLKQRVLELEGLLANSYWHANDQISKASIPNLMGSGCLLQLNHLGGERVIKPIVIRDGLSEETVEAIKKDLKRSWDIATEFKI